MRAGVRRAAALTLALLACLVPSPLAAPRGAASAPAASPPGASPAEPAPPVSWEWLDLRVEPLDCFGCLRRVRAALAGVPGVSALGTRLDAPIVSVRYDPRLAEPSAFVEALTRAGFRAAPSGAEQGTASRPADGAPGDPRAGGAEEARVYTDEDLRRYSGGAPAGAGGAQAESAPGEAGAPGAAPVGEGPDVERLLRERADLERAWRARFEAARERLSAAEKGAWRKVTKPVLVGGGTSFGGATKGVAVPVWMKVWEFVETDSLRDARRAIQDLEEELRRAGLPPGWGRE